MAMWDNHKFYLSLVCFFGNVHEEAFSRAGFKDFEWVSTKIDPDYEDTNNYLADFIDAAPNVIFKAKRPKSDFYD